ncbi:hypothetical protein GQ53DRAFT_113371 [Thozetella sp. PMI_491]|nr:hypothetical protein GQ53DRAFT_113371 [Thozetella sp. PMI_491]
MNPDGQWHLESSIRWPRGGAKRRCSRAPKHSNENRSSQSSFVVVLRCKLAATLALRHGPALIPKKASKLPHAACPSRCYRRCACIPFGFGEAPW